MITRVNIRPFIERKVAVLRCHRSQVTPDWWYVRILSDVLDPMFREAYFVRLTAHVVITGNEADRFAGLRSPCAKSTQAQATPHRG
jgi:LmbE family N-acetylglucosaminyl deacetylase